MAPDIKNIVKEFCSIKLEEIDKLKLMDRFDTKYLLPASRIPDLLWMMDSRYRVLEVNSTTISTYQTIYLDTPEFLFFNQHITKRNGRLKIRYRTYDSTSRTFLEIKKKTRNDRTLKWRIESSLIDNSTDKTANEFIRSHVDLNPEELKPTLNNSFKRITFACIEAGERITIDFDVTFSEPGGDIKLLPFVAIVELKSDGLAVRSPFADISRKLSLNPTGFSKYCIGSAMLYDLPRKNILKPKLLLLNRIENEYNGSLSA